MTWLQQEQQTAQIRPLIAFLYQLERKKKTLIDSGSN